MNMSATPGATPSESSFRRTPGSPARILVVDDDVVFSETTARVLRTAGFEVSLATDIVMPDRVNGVALSRMAQMRRPGLKVIYLTGYDIQGVEEEVDGPILRKPIDDEQLVTEVRRILAAA